MEYRISDRMAGMKPSVIREILKQMSDPTLISFAGGNPAADSFPKEDIARFSAELLATDPVGMLQYSVSEGVPSVREAMKHFVSRRFHVVRDTDEVLVVSGGQQAIDFAAKCLVNEGDVVAVEDPAFLGAFNTLRSHGAKLVGIPMEEDGVDLTVFEHVLKTQSPRLFYCIPNFQNPTGKTMSYEKRLGVYELCAKYGVPILEDDPYASCASPARTCRPSRASTRRASSSTPPASRRSSAPRCASRAACATRASRSAWSWPSSAATYIPPCGRSACASAS